MKKYILFDYATYYPGGGMEDLRDSYDSITEAIEAIGDEADHAEVVDRDTWEIVATAHREYLPATAKNSESKTLRIKIPGLDS